MMEPVRETAYGKVKGSIRGGVEIYRGIPYADSVGNRRFLPALPPKPWAGVRDCTRNGFYCPQAGVSITASWDFGDYFSGGHPERFGCYEELQGEDRAEAQVASELFGNVLIGQKVFSFFAVIDSQTTGFFILQNFVYELFGCFF